jgi:hypothetical protein
MIFNGLFSAVVEIEWESGKITWEIVAKSVAPVSDISIAPSISGGKERRRSFGW